MAGERGDQLTDAQRRALGAFWKLLLSWNARINLTGAQTEADLVGEHLPDAVVMAGLVPPGSRVVDVGSGGGLPGIPFAVLRPDAPITLVEPRAKRVAFLRTAVRELALPGVTIVGGRMEELPDGVADVAGSRATFEPAEWLERARRLAPRALVFATARVDAGSGQREEAGVEYRTAAGHRRWIGLYCST